MDVTRVGYVLVSSRSLYRFHLSSGSSRSSGYDLNGSWGQGFPPCLLVPFPVGMRFPSIPSVDRGWVLSTTLETSWRTHRWMDAHPSQSHTLVPVRSLSFFFREGTVDTFDPSLSAWNWPFLGWHLQHQVGTTRLSLRPWLGEARTIAHNTSNRTRATTRDHRTWTCETSEHDVDGNMESKHVRAKTCERNARMGTNRRVHGQEEKGWNQGVREGKNNNSKERHWTDEEINETRCNARAPTRTHEKRMSRVGTQTRCTCDLQNTKPRLSEELFVDIRNERMGIQKRKRAIDAS